MQNINNSFRNSKFKIRKKKRFENAHEMNAFIRASRVFVSGQMRLSESKCMEPMKERSREPMEAILGRLGVDIKQAKPSLLHRPENGTAHHHGKPNKPPLPALATPPPAAGQNNLHAAPLAAAAGSAQMMASKKEISGKYFVTMTDV